MRHFHPNARRFAPKPTHRVKFLYEVRRLLVAAKPTLVKYRSRFSGRPTQLIAHYGATLD
jgi:hypothetical protein